MGHRLPEKSDENKSVILPWTEDRLSDKIATFTHGCVLGEIKIQLYEKSLKIEAFFYRTLVILKLDIIQEDYILL